MNRLLVHVIFAVGLVTAAVAHGAPPKELTQRLGYPFRLRFNMTEFTYKTTYPKAVEEDPAAVREHVKKVFRSYVDAPRDVKIDLAPTTREQLLEGRFPRITFSFRDGLFETIPVKRLESDFRNVRLNVLEMFCNDRVRVVHQGKIDYYAEITEQDMNKALFTAGQKLKNVRSPKMELNDDSIRFSGQVRRFLGYTNVRVDGMMKVVGTNKIHFVPSALKVGVLPLPNFVTREIFLRINPLADLGRLNMNAPPDRIVVRRDRCFILTDAYRDQLPAQVDPK